MTRALLSVCVASGLVQDAELAASLSGAGQRIAAASGWDPAQMGVSLAENAERLEAVSARTGNTWTPSELAVANDLFSDATLQDGQVLKISVEESWMAPAQGTTGR